MRKYLAVMESRRKILPMILLLIALTVVLFFSFAFNGLRVVPDWFYTRFQMDSETLVYSNIIAEQQGLPLSRGNLGRVILKNNLSPEDVVYNAEAILSIKNGTTHRLTPCNPDDIKLDQTDNALCVDPSVYMDIQHLIGCELIVNNEIRVIKQIVDRNTHVEIQYYGVKFASETINEILVKEVFHPEYIDRNINTYTSQYGIQGKIFAYLYNKCHLSLTKLHQLVAFSTALVLSILTMAIMVYISPIFGLCFFITILLSPWVVSFSRNLYWIEFSWWLPAVFTFLMVDKEKNTYFYLALFCLGIFFKSLAGYEYLSTIVLFAMSPYIIKAFLEKQLTEKIVAVKVIFQIGLLSVFSFICALALHCYIMTEGDVLNGLRSIWVDTVLRRTYGDPHAFIDPMLKQSLEVPAIDVIKTYIFQWHTDLIKFIPGKAFPILVSIALLCCLSAFVQNRIHDCKKYVAYLFTFCLPPLSWLFLAKGHSFIHLHMNYVLWYFGFLPALFYIILHESLLMSERVVFQVMLKIKNCSKF